MTPSWFFLSTLNYDARSTTHQIFKLIHFLASIQLRAFTTQYAATVDTFHQTVSLPEMWHGHRNADTHSTSLVYDYV